jgi:hypothetical protein
LRVAVSELRIVGAGEQQFAPIVPEVQEARLPLLHLLDDFVAQQSAKPRAYLREPRGVGRRLRSPGEKVGQQRLQRIRRFEFGSRGFNIAVESDRLASGLAVPP